MEKEFINGLSAKKPHEKAPDFVKSKLSIKRLDLIKYLQEQEDEWINADLKESNAGKYYIERDNWKPNNKIENKKVETKEDDNIPF